MPALPEDASAADNSPSAQAPCPVCGKPLNVTTKDNVVYIAECCGAELEPDALTLIDLLPTKEEKKS